MPQWTKETTNGEIYRGAMKVTTEIEAAAYFENMVQHLIRVGGYTRREAGDTAIHNLRHYSDFLGDDIHKRVTRLYNIQPVQR